MEKYTAGQLAELAGVSTRTVRYYDQRGILHPCDYTESGYRLYDAGSLLSMQQIVMLKFAGFSLEEIQGILIAGKGSDLRDILENQYQLISQKKQQTEEILTLLDKVLEQNTIDDLNYLTETMRLIKSINHSIRSYQFCEAAGQRPLYPWEFCQMRLKPGMRVLDVGFGCGMIWRKSWQRIPENTTLDLLDIYASGVEDFRSFHQQKCSELQPGVVMNLICGDAEDYPLTGTYDRILLAYLFHSLREPEKLLEKLSRHLRENGELIVIGGTAQSYECMDRLYEAYSRERIMSPILSRKYQKIKDKETTLEARFRVERVPFENVLEFQDPLTLYHFIMDSDPEFSAEIKKHGSGFVNYLRRTMEQEKTIRLDSDVMLYRCRRKQDEDQAG